MIAYRLNMGDLIYRDGGGYYVLREEKKIRCTALPLACDSDKLQRYEGDPNGLDRYMERLLHLHPNWEGIILYGDMRAPCAGTATFYWSKT